jgi:hypothetical protein
MVYSQIWLKLVLNDGQFRLYHKIGKMLSFWVVVCTVGKKLKFVFVSKFLKIANFFGKTCQNLQNKKIEKKRITPV